MGPTVTDTFPIIANGDRGVNIESTQHGPTTINGVNVTQGDPNLAPIYFLQAGSSGGLVLNVPAPYETQWQYNAENQVFLVSLQFTGNSYPVSIPSGTILSGNVFTVPTATTETINNITIPAAAFNLSNPALSTVKAANPGVAIGYTIRSTGYNANGVAQSTSIAVYTSKGGTLLASVEEVFG